MKVTRKKNMKIKYMMTALLLAVTGMSTQANQPIQTIAVSSSNVVTGVMQAQTSNIAIQVKPIKPTYHVNEAIRFVVKPNQDAYVYILSNEPNGRTVQVFPNSIDKNNLIVANSNQIVPSIQAASQEIYSDRAGTESFTIIASKKPLNLNDLFKVVTGQFASANTDDVQAVLKQYGIILGNDMHASINGNHVTQKHLNVSIHNNQLNVNQPTYPVYASQRAAAVSTVFGNTLMLTTDKTSYAANQSIIVSYGGTGTNHLFLGVRYRDGRIARLLNEPNHNQLKQIQFVATKGMQSLILWESRDANKNQHPSHDAKTVLPLNIH